MANPENKQIPYESTQQDIRDAIESVATAIGGITHPDAEDIVYDNSVSGLSATDVQNALDEIVSDIPTVNNGTLTIQQNGTSKGSFTANSASNVNVNIETPTADKKTATDQFTTADGGLLSKCQINLVPVQSGSGDPSPDNVRPISGHTEVDLYNVGKNNIPMVLSNIKSLNTSGTWNGNNYSVNGITFSVITDSDGNVTEVKILSGTATANANLQLCGSASLAEGVSYILNGCTDGSSSKYRISFYNSTLNAINNYFGGNTFTYSSGTGEQCYIRVFSGYTVPSGGHSLYPMIRLATDTDTSFEPYHGHLYQVQIGSTVYGGYVDLVSGVMTVDKGFITLNGTENITKSAVTDCDIYIYTITPANFSQPFITSAFKYSSTAINAVWYAWRGSSDTQIRIGYSPYGTTTVNDFKTWLSNNPLQICYELATPTTIQLTPQEIETLAGQNNLSTPLSGQSIETNGVEYKELFTFADVKEYVDKKIPNAPTTDGTYTLQAVVSGGVPTYSWV